MSRRPRSIWNERYKYRQHLSGDANGLRQFIERVERLEAEKKDIAEQQKEVMAEAKARGCKYHH
ncbi:DUF2312 domain-containing protein [Sedimentitalea nanhaiensis]|uniref:DUF2312 domain-containing protein n=1 Tax=Sedimentitalea nanhaiensis TaxID=999627 RepID=UPI0004143A42